MSTGIFEITSMLHCGLASMNTCMEAIPSFIAMSQETIKGTEGASPIYTLFHR